MEILLGILMEWLVLNTSVDIQSPPNVWIVEADVIGKRYGAPVHAIYSRTEHAIYISDHVDLHSIEGASVLVHELVHHYQNTSGAVDHYHCAQQSEKLAYATQRAYLEANNVQQLMPELERFNVAMNSVCVMP